MLPAHCQRTAFTLARFLAHPSNVRRKKLWWALVFLTAAALSVFLLSSGTWLTVSKVKIAIPLRYGLWSSPQWEPLPWRPCLQHNTSEQPLAFLVSAFLDTRLTPPHIAIVAAAKKGHNFAGVLCVLQHGTSTTTAALRIAHANPGNGAFHGYQTSVLHCQGKEIAALKGQQELSVTLRRENDMPAPNSWVPVILIHELSPAEVTAHAEGNGDIVICTPPLHTDAYASSLIQWTEFNRIGRCATQIA